MFLSSIMANADSFVFLQTSKDLPIFFSGDCFTDSMVANKYL